MIRVEVENTRIWANWCRRNCGSRWKMELGSKTDSYYFELQEDVDRFQQRRQQYAEQLQHIRDVKKMFKG